MSAGRASDQVHHAVVAQGPWFEDLHVGQVFEGASGLTLTEGVAAVHQSVVGDRLRLGLDHDLSRRVTGEPRPLASPALVWDVAIGQSTSVTHHVVANLFYRGLAFRRMPTLGDTLRTRTEVVALKQNSRRADRPPTGLAALRITTQDQKGRAVLDFWRCAMLPLRRVDRDTRHADDVSLVGTASSGDLAPTGVPWGWDVASARDVYRGPVEREPTLGLVVDVAGGDVVSSAPELARLTLNIARAHHDDTSSNAGRLVYGGHTIGIALSQVARAFPSLLTVLSWEHCDHLGPVREGDTLTSTVHVERVHQVDGARLVTLRSRVAGRSGPGAAPSDVLDWRFVALFD